MATLEIGVPGQIMPPAERAVTMALRAEADGYDAVWWPCHLMGWHPDSLWTEDLTPLAKAQPNPHTYFDPLLMMGVAGSQTERIRVGSVVTDLMRRHPAMVANQMLTLDHLTRGRAILGLGSGEAMNMGPYGIDFSQPVSHLAEGIDVIRLLWGAEGPVDYQGKHHHLDQAVLGLRPFGLEPPQIWLAAHGPRMLALTGAKADGWLPTKISVEDYAGGLEVIRATAGDVGRQLDHFTPGMLGYLLLAPDEETLSAMCAEPLVRALCVMLPPAVYRALGYEPPLGTGGGFHSYIPSTLGREDALAVVDRIPPEVVRHYAFCGTPEQVADQVLAYQRVGLRHLIAWNITGFGDSSLTGWSFKALRQLKGLIDDA
jgi:phthiodiolone/phenolphthiodiolone dimycocerosates ketoreductase